MNVKFLTLDESIAIHARLIELYGGSMGIRDKGLLEAALFRPQTGYYNDLQEMAAALFESLVMNHPFIDGNKRMAFFATDIFLGINGYYLKIDDLEAHQFIIQRLETNTCDMEHLLPWIRNHSKPLT